MLHAPIFECLSLDVGRRPAEVGIGRRHVFVAFVAALVVIVLDECIDRLFEITGHEVGLRQHAVRRGLLPALDLALGLRMEVRAAHMVNLLGIEIISQSPGNITRPSVTGQARPGQHIGIVAALERFSTVLNRAGIPTVCDF